MDSDSAREIKKIKKRLSRAEAKPPGTAASGVSLTVEDQDGVPTVSNVNTIKVSNGTLTDDGGGVVSIDTSGGGTGITYQETITIMALDAGLGITKDGSDLVSNWADQGLYSTDVSQSNGSLQPLWVASAVNSLPAVQFDGSDNYMSATWLAPGLQRVAVVLVCVPLATQTARGIFSWSPGLLSGSPFVLFQRDSTNVKVYVGGDYRWTIAHANNTAKLYLLEGDGVYWRLWVDGTAQTPSNTTFTNQSGANAIFLGVGFNGYANVQIPYCQVWNGFLSSADRSAFMTAVKATYGIT